MLYPVSVAFLAIDHIETFPTVIIPFTVVLGLISVWESGLSSFTLQHFELFHVSLAVFVFPFWIDVNCCSPHIPSYSDHTQMGPVGPLLSAH